MGKGGAREGSGRPREWSVGVSDTYIRVPSAIKSEILVLAHRLDELLQQGYTLSEILSHLSHIKKK